MSDKFPDGAYIGKRPPVLFATNEPHAQEIHDLVAIRMLWPIDLIAVQDAIGTVMHHVKAGTRYGNAQEAVDAVLAVLVEGTEQ